MNLDDNTDKETSVVLVTNHFPYSLYESFIEKELPIVTSHFSKVVILCRDVSSVGERAIHGAIVYRINPTSNWRENLWSVLQGTRHLPKIYRYIRDELSWLKERDRKLTSVIFDQLIHNIVKAVQTAAEITRVLRKERLTGKVVLYSYWLTSSALATTFVSSKRLNLKTIARAHGGDVYEYRNANQYLPFRRTLIQQLDRI